ncbi:MAG TPA: SAM-dependent methyltransferase, partial [Methanobacterium sp.]|nr:SAM-dependent methyltransferase [Methanobacterium sp.]
MYEYVIARTKFIDSLFQKAIESEFEQILIFGAGFDSRSVRFAKLSKKTKIYELDAPVTQNAKISQLKNRGIAINPNSIFIPVDFNKESVGKKLLESGFKKNQKSLFVLEGLTMYLDPVAVEDTFRLINEFAGEGSEVVFDYVYSSVLREENLYYGESEVYTGVKDRNEPWCFGIEKGEIRSFLENYDLKLVEHLNSEDLENKYFRSGTSTLSKVNGTHCIVQARKQSE